MDMTSHYINFSMDKQLENDLFASYPKGLTWQKSIATFHPESAEETTDVFCRAAACDQKLFISGFGNNINPEGKSYAHSLVVKSDRLNCVHDINPGDFYITVGAGYPLKEINHILKKDNLYFPFSDTNYPGSCGGALASGLTAGNGSHTVPLHRFLLSVMAVLPDGTIVRPGAVTFKSVSGYDIARLFFNSWGTLGMVVRLSFRLFPVSHRAQTPRLILIGSDRSAFAAAMTGDSPLAQVSRAIKKEFDPQNILPLV